ncbi:ABC transporter ATP-binding protein [Demequina sediminicola]|uniref:ABC transporter ATP-binding protein n=1 Tax=Demequina sediminicola TaxID=1095026 RepID=UPI000782B0F0|nr:ABC transporter ATP-binding protein [Demequina sediminicola]
MIVAERLTVRYGRTVAVDAVDVVAPTGGVLGLIGPNGSGKTTTLKAILGSVPRDGGRVEIDGEPVDALSPTARAQRVAVVAQEEPSGLPLTAWDSVLLGRSPRLSAWRSYGENDHEIAAASMERAGVLHLAHRSVDDLSGGERQRVLIARALAQEAGHILMDEPTNHLDVRYQHEVLSLVAGLPATVIVVLHDLNLAARYCDEVVLLERGKVVAAGHPGDVLVPEVLEPVYEIDMRRVDVDGVPQLIFSPRRHAKTATAQVVEERR